MKLLLLFLSLLFTGAVPSKDSGGKASHATHRKASFRLANPLVKLARCSGDASCRACSNCNYCGHCAGGGGTCGVCAPSAPRRTYRSPSRTSTKISRSYRGGGSGSVSRPAPSKVEIGVSGDYYVAATTLNLRAAPSADSSVVRVLERNDVVTVRELTNAKWVKVSTTTMDGDVEGYLSRAYLSETETY